MLRDTLRRGRAVPGVSNPSDSDGAAAGEATPRGLVPQALPPELDALQRYVHQQLVDELDHELVASMQPAEARAFVREQAEMVLTQQRQVGLGELRGAVVDSIADDVLGLGPLEPLLRDNTVSEIMVNGPAQIWVERAGRIMRTPSRFRDADHLSLVIERIVSPLGRHVDESSPMVDARLPDGTRVNIVVPPASPRGAALTLRKFARQQLTADDMVREGTMSRAICDLLRSCVAAKVNMIISGGTGTGKTTLLNVLSSFIDDAERIVSIEDPLELQLQQPHVVALEARPPSTEGTRQITQRDLVRNALRMRPDRIIVGEVRGAEAFDMLQAMNTGHDGSIGTVHANSPRDAISRISNMVMMAGFELPDLAIREQVASAIQLIVQISRFPSGQRRITHLTELVGMEGAVITMQDLFVYDPRAESESGAAGALVPTGLIPHFLDRFERAGVELPLNVLQTSRWRPS